MNDAVALAGPWLDPGQIEQRLNRPFRSRWLWLRLACGCHRLPGWVASAYRPTFLKRPFRRFLGLRDGRWFRSSCAPTLEILGLTACLLIGTMFVRWHWAAVLAQALRIAVVVSFPSF